MLYFRNFDLENKTCINTKIWFGHNDLWFERKDACFTYDNDVVYTDDSCGCSKQADWTFVNQAIVWRIIQTGKIDCISTKSIWAHA